MDIQTARAIIERLDPATVSGYADGSYPKTMRAIIGRLLAILPPAPLTDEQMSRVELLQAASATAKQEENAPSLTSADLTALRLFIKQIIDLRTEEAFTYAIDFAQRADKCPANITSGLFDIQPHQANPLDKIP